MDCGRRCSPQQGIGKTAHQMEGLRLSRSQKEVSYCQKQYLNNSTKTINLNHPHISLYHFIHSHIFISNNNHYNHLSKPIYNQSTKNQFINSTNIRSISSYWCFFLTHLTLDSVLSSNILSYFTIFSDIKVSYFTYSFIFLV